MRTLRAMTVLDVDDRAASVRHFEAMGFRVGGDWAEFRAAIVQRGQVTFLLQEADGAMPRNAGWAAYVYVSDAAALRREFEEKGLAGMSAPQDRPWATGEFTVTGPDGHVIAFGEARDLSHGPGLGADAETEPA